MYAVMNASLLFFFYKIYHWTYFSRSSSSKELLDCIVNDYSDEDDFLNLFNLLNLFNFLSFVFWLILFIFFFFSCFFIFCSCHCYFCCCFNSSNVIKFIRWSKSELKEAEIFKEEESSCYDPSYAPMLIAMLMTMLMTIADRSPLGYRVVPRPTLFRVSLCSPESYR